MISIRVTCVNTSALLISTTSVLLQITLQKSQACDVIVILDIFNFSRRSYGSVHGKIAQQFYFLLLKCPMGQLDTVVYIAGQWYKKSGE